MIKCKGRNGRFNFHHVDVTNFSYEIAGDSMIEVYSKQTYGEAPIKFYGKTGDLLDLFYDIIKELEERR